MRIRDMSWHQVEGYLKRDDRAVLPLGSTEQHAGLSLSVDSILAEKVALDAAEPLGIPVFPPVNYGLTPYFLAYPGTVSLRVETYVRLIREILDSWWNAPKTWAKVQEIDPIASHASWMENFPWTRLADIEPPKEQKPMIDFARMRLLDPKALREYLGDGNFGGYYQRPDEEMQAIWAVAVAETRELLEGPWQ